MPVHHLFIDGECQCDRKRTQLVKGDVFHYEKTNCTACLKAYIEMLKKAADWTDRSKLDFNLSRIRMMEYRLEYLEKKARGLDFEALEPKRRRRRFGSLDINRVWRD